VLCMLLDRNLRNAETTVAFPLQDRLSIVKRLIVALLSSSLLNLVWGGTFLQASRTVPALLLLLIVGGFFWATRSPSIRESK
jgi:hypothetical protein